MGDRVSISFTDGSDESVALFCHCGGSEFADLAKEYIKDLDGKIGTDKHTMPLDRREPSTVMVDFVLWLQERKELERPVMSNYYFGKDGSDGDNSDNGHFKIDVRTGKATGGRQRY